MPNMFNVDIAVKFEQISQISGVSIVDFKQVNTSWVVFQ